MSGGHERAGASGQEGRRDQRARARTRARLGDKGRSKSKSVALPGQADLGSRSIQGSGRSHGRTVCRVDRKRQAPEHTRAGTQGRQAGTQAGTQAGRRADAWAGIRHFRTTPIYHVRIHTCIHSAVDAGIAGPALANLGPSRGEQHGAPRRRVCACLCSPCRHEDMRHAGMRACRHADLQTQLQSCRHAAMRPSGSSAMY